jgi:hypothetical protein
MCRIQCGKGGKLWMTKRQKKKRKPKKFTVPKVKVEKQAFDKVLGKLIQSEPQPEKRPK